MLITDLALQDFRSYASLQLTLPAGISVFLGDNGQGKTNLLEAVGYLATLGSHRVGQDALLIRKGAEQAVVKAQVQAGLEDERKLQIQVDINLGKANRAYVNKTPQRRVRDLIGSLRVVLFAPEHLALVKGDPDDRRRFIDELAILRTPRIAGVKADYERAVKQRTQLLRSLAEHGGDGGGQLEIWDDAVAGFGAELLAARLDTLAGLTPLLEAAYRQIAPGEAAATVNYKSSYLGEEPDYRQAILARMRERRREELARGLTLVGPHRDDLELLLDGFPAKGYASHGESWSYALALKLSAFALLRADGLEPVLLLDDVFAELDETRRTRLAEAALSAEQVLVTAAVPRDVPAQLDGARFRVTTGSVVLQPDGPSVGFSHE
ncbi:MAG: DNA replication/repair protein RecF [Propionibacteriaceae bacterium]|jgi:DNA replication and repair protein RecF|nr:DNA replication/repair protein RecF [Propionibacteriaceae bacterium]